jgi:hypothetical protein
MYGGFMVQYRFYDAQGMVSVWEFDERVKRWRKQFRRILLRQIALGLRFEVSRF